MRLEVLEKRKKFDKTENWLKAQQSVGQIIGEVLQILTPEKVIVKASMGPRYVVGVRTNIDQSLLKPGTRVTLDMTTLTIMRILPREVDPLVHNMQAEDVGDVPFNDVGGLSE